MPIGYEDVDNAVQTHGSINKAATVLGISRKKAQQMMKSAKSNRANIDFTWPEIPDEHLPIEDIVERKRQKFQQVKQSRDARNLINLSLKSNNPIGLAFFGDPHTDDDACDIDTLLSHADTVRDTPGLYGCNVGDNNNLWPGRLAFKYKDQITTEKEGWILTEHFISRVRDWLCLMKGNHDHFVGAGDPLDWIRRDAETYQEDYNIRMGLNFPNGKQFRFWLRHDFAGNSQWNGVHGMVKAAKMGAGMHLLVGGHRHDVGYHMEYDPYQDILFHCLRTAGYKMFDDYADKLQFESGNMFQCPVAIIDPRANNPAEFVTVITDTNKAADYLTFLRSQNGR